MTPGFIAHLANFGDATALRDDAGVQLSYRALAAAVADFAERLAGPPGFVLIETRNTIDTVVAIYGAMAAGRATLLTKAADDTGFARLADIYRPASIVRQGAKALRVEAGSDDPAAVHHELALLLSTSGTTGATKLVRLSGDNVDANARSIADYLGITPSDCALANLPLHYSYGLSVLNSHLLAGASVMLTEQAISAPGFRALCERAPITSMAGVPYSYELLEAARFCDWAPPTLRTMSQAGGRMPPEQVLAWHDWLADRGGRLFIMYGQTEATARMAYVDPAVLSQKPDAIGRAIPGGTLSLIDEAGEPVTAAGAEGELIYSGPNVMLGYAEQASDLARGRDIAVLHTGDLAVRDADGDFRLVGRKQRFVKPYGLRVSLDAIEAKLAADGIRAMAAGDDGLIAIAATGHVGPASLRADLARWLSLPENLFDVVVLPEFPMLASGKRDYKSILGAAQLRRMSAKGLDTRGKGFAAQFSAILGREVQQSDSFISLHGDSLSYVNVLIAIDEYLGKVPDNWESLTVAELDALSLAAPVATPRWIKPFDTEVVLRALAIMAVVLVHAKFRIVSGGADALIILAGYNLARFNKGRLTAGLGWEIFENFVKRIILPFYFILLLYTIFRESPGITAFLLVDNLSSDPERLRTILAPFWFIQALLVSDRKRS